MNTSDDFSQAEQWIVETTLKERYNEKIDIEMVETEVRLSPSDRELTPCPALYWEHKKCHFLLCKVGDNRFRGQFFFRVHQQFGTDIEVYDDLTDCVVTLLQAQADHENQEPKYYK